MAITGHLDDFSLAELIEFFCNQRKTGRLKITYARGPALFFFQNGFLVDAKIGVLVGLDAVYYALTLENSPFQFSVSYPPTRRTIHQPWAHVILEGLRRIDEGVPPLEAYPAGDRSYLQDHEYAQGDSEEKQEQLPAQKPAVSHSPRKPQAEALPMRSMVEGAATKKSNKTLIYTGVVITVLALVATLGIPAGWYAKLRPAPPAEAAIASSVEEPAERPATDQDRSSEAPSDSTSPGLETPKSTASEASSREPDRERKRATPEEAKEKATVNRVDSKATTATNPSQPSKPEAPATKPKMVSVQVVYDENGRVTQAFGGDAAAIRIARQKRFPPGRGGTATVTIPIN